MRENLHVPSDEEGVKESAEAENRCLAMSLAMVRPYLTDGVAIRAMASNHLLSSVVSAGCSATISQEGKAGPNWPRQSGPILAAANT